MSLIGADVFDGEYSRRRLDRNDRDDFKVDLREKARPRKWTQYQLANLFSVSVLLTNSQNTDYSSPQKYDNNYYGYTKGHLMAATFMLHFFGKDHPDVVYDHASYLTNIFPQVANSNNPNKDNKRNWFSQELSEYSAAHHCLKTGNKLSCCPWDNPVWPITKRRRNPANVSANKERF